MFAPIPTPQGTTTVTHTGAGLISDPRLDEAQTERTEPRPVRALRSPAGLQDGPHAIPACGRASEAAPSAQERLNGIVLAFHVWQSTLTDMDTMSLKQGVCL